MAQRQLKIKQLSDSGEALMSVACFSGQVSVFRAQSEADLKVWRFALYGMPGAHKFSVTVDDEQFDPSQHIFIGFGEKFPAGETTVLDFLMQTGLGKKEVEPLLLSNGLLQRMHVRCMDLNYSDARMIRMLWSMCLKNKILVLNDPFEPLSAQWRERAAQLLVEHARINDQIVVITTLSARPEAWIDNVFVARIEVGQGAVRTIGASSQTVNVQAIVSQVREALKDDIGLQQELAPKAKSVGITASKDFLPWITGGLALIALLLGLALYWSKSTDEVPVIARPETKSQSSTANITQVANLVTPTVPVEDSSKVAARTPSTPRSDFSALVALQNQSLAKGEGMTALARYSADIQGSIHAAFLVPIAKKASTQPSQKSEKAAATPATSNKSSELLLLLQAASTKNVAPTPEYGEMVSAPPVIESLSDSEWEQRREQMRQRFLEAIAASDQAVN